MNRNMKFNNSVEPVNMYLPVYLIFLVSLSGCATQTSYLSPPVGVPSANIKFNTFTPEAVSVASYPPNVVLESKANDIGVLQYKHLFDNEKDIEIKVASGKPFEFSMKDDDQDVFNRPELVKHMCKSKMSFVPETGKNYLVKFSGLTENCKMDIFTVGANGSEERLPTNSFVRKPWCLDSALYNDHLYINNYPALECHVNSKKLI